MDLTKKSLAEVDRLYREGDVSEEEATRFVRAWNAGPHFTAAVIADGGIRNFDPQRCHFYDHLAGKFGFRPAREGEGA